MQVDLPGPTIGELASVTVTFNPDLELLERQFRSLCDVGLIIVVDNASDAVRLEELRALISCTPGAQLFENAKNTGLAAALNRGIAIARKHAPRIATVLLL
ncbi:MAG: glycosyltransferase family 2 protein, partial [Luteibacter jiangsuensis]